jgi:DNA-binding protein H-NS
MATKEETQARSEREDEELERLRQRVEALERQRVEEAARANAAIAAAQDRSYWLDRWGIDLNALMRRRGAAELRAAIRAARAVYRVGYVFRSRSKGLRGRLRSARAKLEDERSRR